MNKKELTTFLLKARTKTYMGNGGKVKATLKDSYQLEHGQGKWLYRDVYWSGNGIFMGLEVIYYKNIAVWSMSYYGNFKKMKEDEIDSILRSALLKNWKTVRIWKKVEWKKGNYRYVCKPGFKGSINNMAGSEQIFKNKDIVYFFFYAGGLLKVL